MRRSEDRRAAADGVSEPSDITSCFRMGAELGCVLADPVAGYERLGLTNRFWARAPWVRRMAQAIESGLLHGTHTRIVKVL